MANTKWESLKDKAFFIGVGKSKAEALESTNDQVVWICNDNAIVMNGDVIADSIPCVLHLGDYDTEAEALDALAQPIICGNLYYGIIHATYASTNDVLCFQSIDGNSCRQVIWNKTRQFQRGIYFTDSSRSRISWKEDWQFLGLDRLSWSTSGHKYVPNLFGNGYNHDYCDPIPISSAISDGLMSKETYTTLMNLKDRVAKLEAEMSDLKSQH